MKKVVTLNENRFFLVSSVFIKIHAWWFQIRETVNSNYPDKSELAVEIIPGSRD